MATPIVKLETCEVCSAASAKYTCPKCEVRTCCLKCVNIHKKELNCDGIRDKTKFVPINKFTDLDLLSDYRLLEEVGRSVETFQRDPTKRYTRQANLPTHLHKLRTAVYQRHTTLDFMPQNFSRHRENTTYLKWKTNELFWRIEWIFPQAENTKWVDERLPESERLSTLLENVLDPIAALGDANDTIENINLRISLREKLQFYRASGLSNIKILLKSERIKKCDSRFHELDLALTLRENLERKTIIEFPTLFVILRDHSDMYEIIDTDEEGDAEESQYPRRSMKRKPFDNRKCQKKNKEGLPVNFFFDTNLSDSENEAMEIAENANKRKLVSKLDIPEYSALVKMEH